jgi:selenocysteine lyase/cysteine desulfurase
MDKRTFLKHGALLSTFSLLNLSTIGELAADPKNTESGNATDEDFWLKIRSNYDLKTDYINLENGYYNILPQPIREKYEEHIRFVNREGAYYMRTVQFENKKKAATRLAELAGLPPELVVVTRNTTESLDLVISGFDWKTGDEAVMAEQDYGAMLDMFKQTATRYGIVNKVISLPQHPENDEELVALYEAAITPKTKLLMVCQMVNITGQILPVRKICDMAHSKGVAVMVDGAHAFAHLNSKISDLDCDFYGCSLHKWLSAPLGAGMLYMKKEYIPRIFPLFAEAGKEKTDLLRLNHTGTHPAATDLTIPDAIDYYQMIGPERKENRLRYLQQYWTSRAREMKHLNVQTPVQPERSCAIANVGVRGMSPADFQQELFHKYGIYSVAIDSAGVKGCRITPNVFTTTAELDKLVAALYKMK